MTRRTNKKELRTQSPVSPLRTCDAQVENSTGDGVMEILWVRNFVYIGVQRERKRGKKKKRKKRVPERKREREKERKRERERL
jgi:hypothetical protein